MATIRKEIIVDAEPAHVWDAVRDVGAIHQRLAPGFVADTTLEGDTRTVTFANGFVVQERIVTIDDDARRLVYAATGGRTTHHNASFQVFAEPDGRTRLVWLTDLLPDDAAVQVRDLVEQGSRVMQATLSRASTQSRAGMDTDQGGLQRSDGGPAKLSWEETAREMAVSGEDWSN